MTDRAKFEQMLESLINGDQKQAEEIFHELVVAKSREIYENLLDDDVQVDEASDEDEEEEEVEENFDLEAVGGDPADAMIDAVVDGEEGDEMGGDEMDMGDEMGGGDEPATKDDVMDIKDALDELKAEFEAMLAGDQGEEEGGEEEFGGEEEGGEEDEEMKDDVQFEASDDEEDDDMDEGMVREYVEKVAPAKMGDNGVNNKSTVAGKNDMGGTTSNIAKGGESGKAGTNGGLANPATKDLNSGNVNVPGSKTATKMHPTKGHGAEKKGSGDNGANTKSIVGK
jgi:hypothetical protein